MAKIYRTGSHTKTRLSVHLVWVTKYRYKVLANEVKHRCREIVIEDCDALELQILKGVVSSDHIHIHIEYPPKLSISEIMKQLKGRSSRILQKEFPHLKNEVTHEPAPPPNELFLSLPRNESRHACE